MRIAYLVNRYPAVSHTFIRREIQAVESLGHVVERFSIRDTRNGLIDPVDLEEHQKTFVLLNLPRCMSATMLVLFRHPLKLLSGLRATLKMSRDGNRGVVRHLGHLASACHLARELQRRQVQHLHAHFGTNSAAVALLAHIVGGIPYSATVHGPEEFDCPEALSLGYKVAHAKFVVCVSSFGRSQLQRWSKTDDWHKINVVHCGLGADYLGRSTNSVPDVPRLVCIARLSEQKGIFTLLNAAEELARDGMDFELVIVGDGPLRSVLAEKAASERMRGRVQLVGPQTSEQVRHWLETSRCLVLPSFAEGLPVVIMEAFALARPVISTYVAGIPELVVNGQNGLLVPAGNSQDLAHALKGVLKMPVAELSKMGQLGRQQVCKRHNSQTEAKKLVELFLEDHDM
jgi:glycosyltransferase involved in cell wall biosynthesis